MLSNELTAASTSSSLTIGIMSNPCCTESLYVATPDF
jgi:hypothetical protein